MQNTHNYQTTEHTQWVLCVTVPSPTYHCTEQSAMLVMKKREVWYDDAKDVYTKTYQHRKMSDIETATSKRSTD